MTLIRTIFLLLLAFASLVAQSQNYPVTVFPTLTPPYTPFLTDLTDPGANRLSLQILLNDLTVTEYRCRLRMTIEGVNISITNKPEFVPPPLTLSGGVPLVLYGSDLSEYFRPSNLILKGISSDEFERKGGQLPEGIYRFTFEILDFNRGTVVSNKGSETAWMLLNDPPFINLPSNNEKIKPLSPQNVVFQWTPRHRGSPNAAFSTVYDVKLVEIWPRGRNPFDAMNSLRPIFETSTDATLVVYGPSETPLVPGREYALQVRARDTNGLDLFKNNGYSEVVRFVYGDECLIPVEVQSDQIGTVKARLKWQGGSGATGYSVRYRQSSTDAAWFEKKTDDPFINVDGMRPATPYEFQVCSECESIRSEYTRTQTFTTLSENPNALVCGNGSIVQPPDGSGPLPLLMSNDIIRAGGFEVIVTQAQGSNGRFTGRGLAVVPWFNSARIRVTFENISVNRSYQLTGGVVNSVWDKDSKLLKVTEQTLAEGNDPSSSFKSEIATFEADSLVSVRGMVISVSRDSDGNTIIGSNAGPVVVLQQGKSYAVADEVGNGYLVDKEGNIRKTTSADALAAGARGAREYLTDPGQWVTFHVADQMVHGLDEHRDGTLPEQYQLAENDKFIAWKALASGEPDVVTARADDKATLTKMKFKVEGFSSSDPQLNGDVLTLMGKTNGVNEELLAWMPSADTTKHELVAGKLNLVSYDKINLSLVVVEVNGAALPGNTGNLQQQLNEVYGQAVVNWASVTKETLSVEGIGDVLDTGESGLLSNYTSDMKLVLNAYLSSHDLATDTYYLFIVAGGSDPQKLGYMPRKKQAGFIFLKAHKSESEVVHTIAHELGHGAFRLKHTFSEYPSLPESSTDNLMDYRGGVALNKYQWDYIHNPEAMLGLFEDDDEGNYQTDGHYWTVYLVSLMIGISDDMSRELAYHTEFPDGVIIGNEYSERYTWLEKDAQEHTHVLNGKYGPDVTRETIKMIEAVDRLDLEEMGRLLHRLGDSFAHRKLDGSGYLYGWEGGPPTWEHFFPHQSAPDMIKNRPGLYEEYVDQLMDVLINKYPEAKVTNKVFVWQKIHELSMYATINKVSLIGIINYEVAEFKKEDSFVVHLNYSYLPTKESYQVQVQNTIKYLREKSVSFNTALLKTGTLFRLTK